MIRRTLRYLFRFLLFVIAIASGIGLFVVLPIQPKHTAGTELGVTYSIYAAEALGLDWRKAYADMLTDLSPAVIRIPVYWDLIEPKQGQYNWEPYDYQLNLLDGRKIKIILSIGRKLPRWPECHIPDWLNGSSKDEIINQERQMITQVVERYRNSDHIYSWQVENEPLFQFGSCPSWSTDRNLLKDEINLVRTLDPSHQVSTSDSGELSGWLMTSTLPIDSLDISLYRSVYTDKTKYFFWPTNPYFYLLHILAIRPLVKNVVISELQMEPWGPAPVWDLKPGDIYTSFSPLDFHSRIDFAQRTGAKIILTWGLEWWYYMKEVKQMPEYWQEAIKAFQQYGST